MNRIKSAVFILILLSSKLSYGIDIQYFFDERYTIYSASSSHPYKAGGIYKHKNIMDQIASKNLHTDFRYINCQKDTTSDLIIRLKPNFFYNPLMTIMYSELEVDFFTGVNNFITTKTFKDEKVMVFDIQPVENLLSVYKNLLEQVNRYILNEINKENLQNIDRSFCQIL